MKPIVESILNELARKKGLKANAPSVGNIPHGQLDLNAGKVLDETGISIRILGEYYKRAPLVGGNFMTKIQAAIRIV